MLCRNGLLGCGWTTSGHLIGQEPHTATAGPTLESPIQTHTRGNRTMKLTRQLSQHLPITLAIALVCSTSTSLAADALPSVSLDVRGAFPDSITSTEDGGLILGSVGGGAIYQIAPGSSKAEPWIVPAAAGHSVFGVLADESRNTLWACSVVLGPGDQAQSELKRYNLRDGKPQDSYAFPGGGLCNDI